MITKKTAETPTVQSRPRGIERWGSWLSSPIDAAASKPTKSRMPSSTPEKTVPMPVVPGLKAAIELPLSPPLAMMTSARISMGTNEIAAKVSMARMAMRTPR
jgi:hypothetical protein